MHPKTPILNGYKYFAINVTINQRKKLKKDTDLLKEVNRKTKKNIINGNDRRKIGQRIK